MVFRQDFLSSSASDTNPTSGIPDRIFEANVYERSITYLLYLARLNLASTKIEASNKMQSTFKQNLTFVKLFLNIVRKEGSVAQAGALSRLPILLRGR